MNNGMLNILKIITGTYLFSVLFIYLFINSYLPKIDVVQTHKNYSAFLSNGKSFKESKKLTLKALNLKVDLVLVGKKQFAFVLGHVYRLNNIFNDSNIFNSFTQVHFIRAPSVHLS